MGYIYAERHYSKIVPRLMVEKYLEDQGDSVSLLDYKFYSEEYRLELGHQIDISKVELR